MKSLLIISSLILWIIQVESGSLRYCIPKGVYHSSKENQYTCNKLKKNPHEIQCTTAADRLACFKLLSSGKVDFMVAEPEDLRVMSTYNESHVMVTHELKKFAKFTYQPVVEMIAIVKSEFNNSWTTKGKNLCYLGLEVSHEAQFEYYYTSYFESWLFPRSCDPKKSLLENRIASLSNHFKKACIAGSWTLDEKLDAELKSKYKNLCALCSNPTRCHEFDRYYGMRGAMTCLRQGVGDVAWLSRSYASENFPQLAADGYTLLCPDGTFANLTDGSNSTCTWIVDPRPVVVANKDVAHIIIDHVTDNPKSAFYRAIHSSYKFSYLQRLPQEQYVKNYLLKLPGYYSASIKSQTPCRKSREVRWCVSSDLEARKCRSLQRAANALELNPIFSCVTKKSRDEAIQAVKSGNCDVFVAKPSEESKAKSNGLKSIIEMMPNERDEANTVAAIVRKNSQAKTYADLKGAKACFTGYRTVGWNSFFSVLKNISAEWECRDVEGISKFFGESCVLGADATFPNNLHSLCHKRNETQTAAHLGVEEKTFQCLEDGADVAFVNVTAAKEYYLLFNTKYKILCPNAPQDASNSCFLAKVSLGSIVVHKNIAKVKEDDIYQMFVSLNRFFGRTYDRETAMFELYGPYEGESNVIFPDATMDIEKTMPGVQYGKDAENLDALEQERCKALKSSSSSSRHIEMTIFVYSVFSALYSYNLLT